MPAGIEAPAAPHPAPAERGDGVRRALHRRSLHVMQHAADAAHFLSAARASRSPVDQRRERRAMPRRLARTTRVRDQNAPVVGREPEHEVARRGVVRRKHRGHQASAAAPCERNGIGGVAIGDERRDRSERLDLVHRPRRVRVPAAQQQRRERTLRDGDRRPSPRTTRASRPRCPPRARARRCVPPHRRAARGSPGAPCRPPRCADRPPRSWTSEARSASTASSTKASGTSALRIAVHFWPALTVSSRVTSRMNRSNSALPGAASGRKNARVERVRLGGERHGPADHASDGLAVSPPCRPSP